MDGIGEADKKLWSYFNQIDAKMRVCQLRCTLQHFHSEFCALLSIVYLAWNSDVECCVLCGGEEQACGTVVITNGVCLPRGFVRTAQVHVCSLKKWEQAGPMLESRSEIGQEQ